MVGRARLRYVLLLEIEQPSGEDVRPAFEEMLHDADASKDGYRMVVMEPPQFLEWLIKMYCTWLHESDEARQYLIRIRDVYSHCSDGDFYSCVRRYWLPEKAGEMSEAPWM